MAKLIAKEYESFENIKQIDENGNEYWSARDLQTALEYTQWRNFSKVIDRAMLACKNSDNAISEHFFETAKAVEMPSKPRKNQEEIGFAEVSKTKNVIDYRLDSPNNAETDQEKKNQVYQYICENISENQLIVSGIGYANKKIECVEFDKVIELDNQKYNLLQETDYTENVELLKELSLK
ncbi:MAG: hypothetical protein FWG45_03155 [Oscillospiraceae bacterium]|nr:hypothetical protein [Oscillospiraceae bacterium]